MKPTTGQAKVHIGSRYERPWFEQRNSDGSYAGYKSPMTWECHHVQKALLKRPKATVPARTAVDKTFIAVASLCLIAAGVLAVFGPQGGF
jgi:hypothetical protein